MSLSFRMEGKEVLRSQYCPPTWDAGGEGVFPKEAYTLPGPGWEMSPRGHPFCDCFLPGAAQKRLPPTRMTPPYNHVAFSQRCQGQEGEWGGGCFTLLTSQPWL